MENPCPKCGHVCDRHVQEPASAEPITHEWLKSVGFRWAEWERSGGKHWILWFGNCQEDRELFSAAEDVGIELAESINLEQFVWSCWLRSDFSHKYGRFIHIRHVWTQQEVIEIVIALSGVPWKPENHLYGAIRRQREADYLRRTANRLDRLIVQSAPWSEQEKDESRARPSEFGENK